MLVVEQRSGSSLGLFPLSFANVIPIIQSPITSDPEAALVAASLRLALPWISLLERYQSAAKTTEINSLIQAVVAALDGRRR